MGATDEGQQNGREPDHAFERRPREGQEAAGNRHATLGRTSRRAEPLRPPPLARAHIPPGQGAWLAAARIACRRPLCKALHLVAGLLRLGAALFEDVLARLDDALWHPPTLTSVSWAAWTRSVVASSSLFWPPFVVFIWSDVGRRSAMGNPCQNLILATDRIEMRNYSFCQRGLAYVFVKYSYLKIMFQEAMATT